jgi:hypothetical protein
MTDSTKKTVLYSEADRANVAAFAFKGQLGDQQQYLDTLRALKRFFLRTPQLKDVLTEDDAVYDQVSVPSKIVAVDILRDAFVTEPAHSFTTIHSQNEDPRAIHRRIYEYYNQGGETLEELEYRTAMGIVSDGTMLQHESVEQWILRMAEAHHLLRKIGVSSAKDEDWHKDISRRAPTVKDTVVLMLRGRTPNEQRGYGADTSKSIWYPYPDWFPPDLVAKVKAYLSMNTPTLSDLLTTYITWCRENASRMPAQVLDETVRKVRHEPTVAEKFNNDDKGWELRTDGKPARCIHELHRNKLTHPESHAKAGQCVYEDTDGCRSRARWQKKKKASEDSGGRKRRSEETDDKRRSKKPKTIRLTLDSGAVRSFTHCPTLAATGTCELKRKCPFNSLHGKEPGSKHKKHKPSTQAGDEALDALKKLTDMILRKQKEKNPDHGAVAKARKIAEVASTITSVDPAVFAQILSEV